MARKSKNKARHLAIVLGDQLNRDSAIFDDFDKDKDVVWMAEVEQESTHVWTHKARIVLFLSAMRHFRDSMRSDGYRVDYKQLDDEDCRETLSKELAMAIERLNPERLVLVHAGEYRVQQAIEKAAQQADLPLDVLDDTHFLTTPDDFRKHAEGRKQLRMEYFYREVRRKTGILMEDDEPAGGEWNFDKENRGSFGKSGPSDVPSPLTFRSHGPTQEVLDLVAERFESHPGEIDHFNWPTTPSQAERALDHFIQHVLPKFGDYQDALWTDEPFLYHSLLSSSLNLKLLNPRQVVSAAEQAYRDGDAPINAVEGFIRQILGWREYVRGIYWLYMPEYQSRNALEAKASLPDFYWTGKTEMHCLSQAIDQTLQHGYAHHIQRLMITGLFSLLFGVDPKEVHEWYLAVYVDAVEWVELPNTLGMSQYGDGGEMASKPYCASGAYINRMSNYCKGCRFKPADATGDDACPFTTLYWDFLNRNRDKLNGNNRMNMQLKNLERKTARELSKIKSRAKLIRTAVEKNEI